MMKRIIALLCALALTSCVGTAPAIAQEAASIVFACPTGRMWKVTTEDGFIAALLEGVSRGLLAPADFLAAFQSGHPDDMQEAYAFARRCLGVEMTGA